MDAVKRQRRDARRHETAHAKYLAELDRFTTEGFLTELRRVQRRRRRDAAPDAVVSARSRCSCAPRSTAVGAGPAGDADFLDVRRRSGRAAVAHHLEGARRVTAPDLRWGTPVHTNLQPTGSLAIVGEPGHAARRPQRRARLAAMHSPADVRLTVLCDDADGDEWGFARWLPHTFQGEQGCRIAADRELAGRAAPTISQLLDTRREFADNATSRQVPLPIHVVVIDDTELLTPEELTELLVHGPAHGIVAITVDPRLSPEGAGATLTSGQRPGRPLHVPEPPPAAPRRGDRRRRRHRRGRAGGPATRRLRPTISDEQGIAGGVVHLVDLLDGGRR